MMSVGVMLCSWPRMHPLSRRPASIPHSMYRAKAVRKQYTRAPAINTARMEASLLLSHTSRSSTPQSQVPISITPELAHQPTRHGITRFFHLPTTLQIFQSHKPSSPCPSHRPSASSTQRNPPPNSASSSRASLYSSPTSPLEGYSGPTSGPFFP